MNYEPAYGYMYLRTSISSRGFHQIVGFWGEIVTYQELICVVTLLTSLVQPQRRQKREKKQHVK